MKQLRRDRPGRWRRTHDHRREGRATDVPTVTKVDALTPVVSDTEVLVTVPPALLGAGAGSAAGWATKITAGPLTVSTPTFTYAADAAE